MNRIDRLSAILVMLQSSNLVRPKHISERFGIGIRTVYRDIRALEESGIPIAGDSRLGYSLVDGFKLPPLMFTDKEAFAFLIVDKLAEKFTDSGLQESYKSGISKIRAVMNIAEKEIITVTDPKIGHLDFHSPVQINSQVKLQELLSSISKHEKIEITYISQSKNEETIRLIDPIGIFFSMANWYLVAFCNTRNDYRTFKVNRIINFRGTGTTINKKHPPLDSFLDKLKNKTDLYKAVLEVASENLPVIDDSKYYQGLVSEVAKGKMIELHFMTFSLERLARWSLSYIDIVTVTYPNELKLTISNILEKREQ